MWPEQVSAYGTAGTVCSDLGGEYDFSISLSNDD